MDGGRNATKKSARTQIIAQLKIHFAAIPPDPFFYLKCLSHSPILSTIAIIKVKTNPQHLHPNHQNHSVS